MADDRDIKIYVKKSMTETGEFQAINDEIQLHVANGNRDKAVVLGQRMAAVRPEDGIVSFGELNMTAALLYQTRVLLTFMAEYSIQRNIAVEFLAETASSAMYEHLKTNESGYYNNISDGAAFTFYLLALKKEGDATTNIGEQFAMLCNINWPEIVELGKRIFTESSAYFDRMINETSFENI